MRPLLLSMQFALCIDGSSERRRLTTPPTNMTRWNIALRLELKDSIMPWTKWLVAWSNDLATTHSAFECSKDCLPGYIICCSNVISSPEFCTLEDIRENARQIEEISLRAWNTFKGSSATGNNSRSSTYRATTPRNNNIPRSTPASAARNNPSRSDTKGKSSIRNNGDNRATVGTSNPHPSQRSNYNNNLTHKTGGIRDISLSPSKTREIICYNCVEKEH